jgi:hypothetical protein
MMRCNGTRWLITAMVVVDGGLWKKLHELRKAPDLISN